MIDTILILLGMLLLFLSFVVPILAFLSSGVRDRLGSMRFIGDNPPRWKVVLGSFGYLLVAGIIITSAGALLIPPDPVQLQDAKLDRSSVYTGESVNVSAVAENTGNETESMDVALMANGEEQAAKEITLRSGESQRVVFKQVFNEPGTYEIEINGDVVGELEVKSNLEIVDSELSATDVRVGDNVEVNAEVENVGKVSESIAVELTSDGTVLDSKEVSLGSGESRGITLSTEFDETGEYPLQVNGKDVGTVTVESVATTSTATQTTTKAPESVVEEPEYVPGYEVERMRDVSFAGAKRGAIDVTVEGELVDLSEEELLSISKDIVRSILAEEDMNSVIVFYWHQAAFVGEDTAYASVTWAPNGEWGEATNVETGDYSKHEFAIDGSSYFVVTDVQAPDSVEVGESFTITATIKNRGIEEGSITAQFEDLDENLFGEYEIELKPGEKVTIESETISFEEEPILEEQRFYVGDIYYRLHGDNWVSINVSSPEQSE